MTKQYKRALFIGRFQPFHKGHLYSLEKCLELAEKVVIVVGSSQEQGTENNPWSYEQRERMVQDVVKDNGLQDVVVKIVGVPDNPSDVAWLANVREIVPEFDVVISNNEWVLSIFREAGVETIESGLYNRDELEGVKIRGLIKANNRSWVSRVPKVIYKLIEEYTSK